MEEWRGGGSGGVEGDVQVHVRGGWARSIWVVTRSRSHFFLHFSC